MPVRNTMIKNKSPMGSVDMIDIFENEFTQIGSILFEISTQTDLSESVKYIKIGK